MRRSFLEALRFFFVQLRWRIGGIRRWECDACRLGPVGTRLGQRRAL